MNLDNAAVCRAIIDAAARQEAREAAIEAEHARQHREAMTPDYRASLWDGEGM